MTPRWNALWIAAAICLSSHAAIAAPQKGDESMGFGEPSADSAFLEGQEAQEPQSEDQQALAAPAQPEDTSRAEDPSKPYYLVGLRLRWIMVPMWFIGMFGVDIHARDNRHLLINNAGVGGEFTYRKDGLDITAAIWWVGLSWKDAVAFKESGEPATSYEVVTNDLSSLLFSVDFVWSTSFTDWFALTYGVGIGIGIPIAPDNKPFVRTESNVDENADGLVACGSGDWSNDATNGCANGEQNHEVYKLPTGIVPWINLLGGMRFKPARHWAIYTDFGFGVGFQAGVRGGYIF
jgi:hypothetical protein